MNIPTSATTQAIALDFGDAAVQYGLSVDTTLNVTTRYGGRLGLGATTDAAANTVFLDPGSNLQLGVTIQNTSINAALHLSFLEATLTGSLSAGASIKFTAVDPTPGDGRITISDIDATPVETLFTPAVGTTPAPSFAATLTANVGGLTIPGVTAGELATATFGVTLDNGGGTFGLLGDESGSASPVVTFTVGGALVDLLAGFSNIGPSDVLGMLQQVLSLLSSMASTQALDLQIPFTGISIGDAIDFATAFKTQALDPLFKSGDASKPDANGDGQFDASDINFSSIQSLLDKLTSALGLAPGTLKANYDPATKQLTFPFSFDSSLGMGTPVAIVSQPAVSVISVQNGGGSQKEIQLIVVNASGGTFTIGLNGGTTAALSAAANNAAAIQTAIQGFQLNGASIGAHVNVSKSGNVYKVVFDASVGDVPLLGGDGSSLTGTLANQTVIVPGGTSKYWLAYENGSGQLQLTSALSAGSDVDAALEALAGIGSGNASVASADMSSLAGSLATGVLAPTILAVTLSVGSPKRLVAAGGFSLDFGTSLGDLASLRTSGDVIPLAQLSLNLVFGIDLNTTQALQIAPAAGQNGPRATITTTTEGGKLASVSTQRNGDGTLPEIQQLTVRSAGGTFTLSYSGSTQTVTGSSPGDAAIVTALNGLSLTGATVTHIDTAAGRVFTIEFSGTADIAQLVADATSLTGRHEVQTLQVTSATGGTFVVANASTTTTPLVYNVAAGTLAGAVSGLGSAVTVPAPTTIANLGLSYAITFSDLLDHDALVVDGSQLLGALDNGILSGPAHLEIQLYSGVAVQVLVTQLASASATVSTTADGGRTAALAAVSTGVYDLTVRGTSGTYRLTYTTTGPTVNSATLNVGDGAGTIQTALGNLGNVGPSHVAVAPRPTSIGGAVYRITFTGVTGTLTADSTGASKIETETAGDGSTNEVQKLTLDPAAGPFALAFANPTPVSTGLLSPSITAPALETALNAVVPGGVTVTSTVAHVYEIAFSTPGDQPLLQLDASTITGRNEQQTLTITGAVSGTFTIGYGASSTSPLDVTLVDATALISAIGGIYAPGVSVTFGSGHYTIEFNGGVNVGQLTTDGSALVAQNEQQTVTVINATGGTFRLSYNGHKTGPLSPTIAAGALATELTTAVGTTVAVTGGSGVYVVEFQGTLAHSDAAQLIGDASGLVNGTQLGTSMNVTVAVHVGPSDVDTFKNEVRSAINAALVAAGVTPGFAGLTTGAISSATTAGSDPFAATGGTPPWDVLFTVTVGSVTAPGVVTRAAVLAAGVNGLAPALQAAIAKALQLAGVAGVTVAVDFNGTKLRVTPSGGTITLTFGSPITVDAGGGRLSVSAGAQKYSALLNGAQTQSVDFQPRTDISVDYADPAFQGLGVTSTPTRFDYSTGTKNSIEFTLVVNGTEVPVSMTSTAYSDIAGLVSLLSTALSSALTTAGLNSDDVVVCRVNLDPNADPADHCNGTGSRIVLEANKDTVQTLSIFVPDTVGGLPNGAITQLGFAAGQSETKRARASVFFLRDVALSGSFQFVVSSAAVTASLGFLALTATGHGTLGPDSNRLVDLTGSIELKNPLAPPIVVATTTPGDGSTSEVQRITLPQVGIDIAHTTFTLAFGGHTTGAIAWNDTAANVQAALLAASITGVTVTPASVDPGDYSLTFSGTGSQQKFVAASSAENTLDLDVLGAAIGTGKVFYDSTQAGPANPRAPPTGFVKATVSGGLGATLALQPDGFLKGISDAIGGLNASFTVDATAANWLDGIPTPTFSFTGPDVSTILDRFQHLDFATIIAGLQAVVDYLQQMAADGNGPLADILNTQLPLVNKSLADLLDVASSVATTINAIVSNPSGAIQELNNRIAAALGLTVPSLPLVSGTLGANELQTITVANAQHGSFTLSFKGATTASIPWDSSAATVQAALEALSTIGPANVHVTTTSVGGHVATYAVEFQNALGGMDVPALVADATKLVNAALLEWDAAAHELDFNFDLGASTSLTRPFSLDLASLVGSPSGFLGELLSAATSFVGIGGSGSLSVSASATLHLKLGLTLDTSGSGSFFIKTGPGGTSFTATASASATDLNFQAKIGPFGLFVKNGSAAIGATATASLFDADGDGRFVILGYGPGGLATDFGHIGELLHLHRAGRERLAHGHGARLWREQARLRVAADLRRHDEQPGADRLRQRQPRLRQHAHGRRRVQPRRPDRGAAERVHVRHAPAELERLPLRRAEHPDAPLRPGDDRRRARHDPPDAPGHARRADLRPEPAARRRHPQRPAEQPAGQGDRGLPVAVPAAARKPHPREQPRPRQPRRPDRAARHPDPQLDRDPPARADRVARQPDDAGHRLQPPRRRRRHDDERLRREGGAVRLLARAHVDVHRRPDLARPRHPRARAERALHAAGVDLVRAALRLRRRASTTASTSSPTRRGTRRRRSCRSRRSSTSRRSTARPARPTGRTSTAGCSSSR